MLHRAISNDAESFAPQEPDDNELRAILAKHGNGHGDLIALLEDIQAKYGYLPESALRTVSEHSGRGLVDIYGIATFYRLFSLKPRGKHLVCACLGTACHVRGAPAVAEEIQRQLGIEAGETTPDGQFSFETVNCLGACALGPIVLIDGRYFSKVRKRKVRELLERASAERDDETTDRDGRHFPLVVHCPHCNQSLMDTARAIDGHPSIGVSVLGDGWHDRLRLSSMYGSYRVDANHDIPRESVARFFCPHCHEELTNGTPCPTCEAPLVPLLVEGGGMLQFCSRRGCEKHMLDLV
jgi:NADH:ubiquinone oxidoreductase subunit E